MTRNAKLIAAAATGLVLVAGIASLAIAQGASPIAAAIKDGVVGEQADGYLGYKSPPSVALRAQVDALNIKRRAAYTTTAEQRGVTIKDVAAAVGCKTLANRVEQGEAYRLPDGVWRVRGADPIDLPPYCAS
jgi:uncharacterized protein